MNRGRQTPEPKLRQLLEVPRWKAYPMCKTCGKRAYPTEEVALRALLRRRSPYPLRYYECPDGHGWHLTKRRTWDTPGGTASA